MNFLSDILKLLGCFIISDFISQCFGSIDDVIDEKQAVILLPP